MKKAIQYGAGNIGRGFIGQLFYQSGYETVFIDVNKEIVNRLNTDRCYPIEIVGEKTNNEIIVKNVRAVDGMDMERVSDEIADAEIMATAVGVNILPRIMKTVAEGLKKRWNNGNLKPFNILICENLMNADHYMEEMLKNELTDNEKVLFDKTIGLVEASIGRMVPVMTHEMQNGNILKICVEEYCQLPVDKDAFKGDIPDIVNMIPFSPFRFYIQRKLFIHNLGHATVAYFGHLYKHQYIWEANGNPYIRLLSSKAMQESAFALSAEHNVPLQVIMEHIDDLSYRFSNRYLCDTVDRVGKDPIRKLLPNDRLIGAAELCLKHGIRPAFICAGIAAALCFSVNSDPYSVELQKTISKAGPGQVLSTICGLSESSPIRKDILEFYSILKERPSLESIFSLVESNKRISGKY